MTARPLAAAHEPAGTDGEDRIYRRTNDAYPAPDPTFTRTELVDQLLDDISRFRRGEESLPAAAAAALRRLRALANGNDSVTSLAASLNVEPDVIAKAIELAAQDRAPAGASGGPPSYRGPEWQWLQEALFRLTLQAGRAGDGPPQSKLAQGDFADAALTEPSSGRRLGHRARGCPAPSSRCVKSAAAAAPATRSTGSS